ncbi:hypothetical protein LINPERPRIM_LOCUS29565 [Linum perenne]
MPRNRRWRFLCDGSYKGEIQQAGIGIIVVSPEGQIVDGVADRFLCRDSIVAEAYAVLAACRLAKREGVAAEVWSDCRQVVKACLNPDDACPWECEAVIAEIRETIRDAPQVSIVSCNRERVAVADSIAKRAREQRLEFNWIANLVGNQVD